MFEDQEFGCWSRRLTYVFQDCDAVGGGPIVEDSTHEVHGCVLNGLYVKEAMC